MPSSIALAPFVKGFALQLTLVVLLFLSLIISESAWAFKVQVDQGNVRYSTGFLVLDWDRNGFIETIGMPTARDASGNLSGSQNFSDDSSSASRFRLFDHDGDGQKEITGWVGPNDAILTYDVDGDGVISSGKELLGHYSQSFRTQIQGLKNYSHGFEALAQFDTNHDDRIEFGKEPGDPATPAIEGQLYLWTDRNSDAISQPGELVPLAKTDLWQLNLKSHPASHNGYPTTSAGNTVVLQSSFRCTKGDYWLLAHVDVSLRPAENVKVQEL